VSKSLEDMQLSPGIREKPQASGQWNVFSSILIKTPELSQLTRRRIGVLISGNGRIIFPFPLETLTLSLRIISPNARQK